MRVTCVEVPPVIDARPDATSIWVREGESYDVIEIFVPAEGDSSYHLLLGRGDMGIFLSRYFTVSHGALPDSWIAYTSLSGTLTLGPRAWSAPGFLEEYYDDDPVAVEAVRSELRARGLDHA